MLYRSVKQVLHRLDLIDDEVQWCSACHDFHRETTLRARKKRGDRHREHILAAIAHELDVD